MPLRTEVAGPIPASHAATLSVQVAEETARALTDLDFNIPPGIFCKRFVNEMDLRFKFRYPKLGARVNR
jgi:hypothetical protein